MGERSLRLEWNYADEGTIGDAVQLSNGMHPRYLRVKLMEKFRHVVDFIR